MSFEEAVPYVAAAYAVILVTILAWAALAARRTARLRRRLDDLERVARAQHPPVARVEPRPDVVNVRQSGAHDSSAESGAIREERQPGG